MPAVYYDSKGTMREYFPPLPKPQSEPKSKPESASESKPEPSNVDTPHFQHLLHVAGTATKAYDASPTTANETTLNNDWNDVAATVAEQYRLALTSSNPSAAVASLDKQYAHFFQNSSGSASYIYHEDIIPGAQAEVRKETTGERKAEIKLYNALNESGSSPNKALDVTQADIDVHLQTLYGKGKNGVYTAEQIQAAATAAGKDFNPAFAPFVKSVATSMAQGQTFSTLLKALETSGSKATPGEITSLETKGLKLTPADVAALGTILTPTEKKSGALTLTAGQAQVGEIDPVTLALFMTAGIKVPPQLSPQMVQLAKDSPSVFFYTVASGVNISIIPASGKTSTSLLNLGNGQALDITINGKPITVNQLPSDSPTSLVGTYLGAAATGKASGMATSGVYDVATQLLTDPNLHLLVTPSTLSQPGSNSYLTELGSLAMDADAARTQYANTQLTSLLAKAPDPASSGATAYIANVINPFLTTQLNGFFSNTAATNFWNNSPAIQNANPTAVFSTSPTGWAPPMAPTLQHYMQTWLAGQFKNLGQPNGYATTVTNTRQVLSQASPELANMLIPMLETQVGKLPQQSSKEPPFQALFDVFSEGVQIADQLPGAPKNAAATQVIDWMKSLGQPGVLLGGPAGPTTLEQDTAYYGYTDLPNALASSILSGSQDASLIQSGEQAYNAQLQSQLGSINYKAFESNRTQTLKAFFGQFSTMPDFGKPISTSNTAALTKGIMAVYGFTPKQVTYTTKKTANGTVQVPTSQAAKIISIDLNWIKSQSIPGSTVTILPFLFASPSIGTQTGVFFDISNPQNNPLDTSYWKTQWTGGKYGHTETVWTGPPPQVLIDGSAAQVALQANPNAWQNPNSVGVKWHYSGISDFQLNNDLYQGGTIYALPGNPLGIGSNGVASSTTNFGKDVVNDIVNVAQVAGIVAAPFTDGLSLTITGTASLLWGSYQAVSQYNDVESHGENFWRNSNTGADVFGDSLLALNWATLGVGGAAEGFEQTATSLAGVNSKIATGFDLAKTGLEYVGYGAGYAQALMSVNSFAANVGHESRWTAAWDALGLVNTTVPFIIEPMIQGAAQVGRSNTSSPPDAEPAQPPVPAADDAAAHTGGLPPPPTGSGGSLELGSFPSMERGSPDQTFGLTVPPVTWLLDAFSGLRRWTADAPSGDAGLDAAGADETTPLALASAATAGDGESGWHAQPQQQNQQGPAGNAGGPAGQRPRARGGSEPPDVPVAGRGGGSPPGGQRPAAPGTPDPNYGAPKTLGQLGYLYPDISFENILALRDYSYGNRPLPALSLENTIDYLHYVFDAWNSAGRQKDNGQAVFIVDGERVTGSYTLYSRPLESHPLTDGNGRQLSGDAAQARAYQLFRQAADITALRPSGRQGALLGGLPWMPGFPYDGLRTRSFLEFARSFDQFDPSSPNRVPIAKRIYVNVARERGPAVMQDFVQQVLDDDDAYPGIGSAKIGNPSHERKDSIVIYLDGDEAVEGVVRWLKSYQGGNRAAFNWEVPAMTEQVAAGIGLGDEVTAAQQARSFGQLRARVIDRVLSEFPVVGSPDIYGVIRPDVGGFIGRVLNGFRAEGINVNSPHLNDTPPAAGGI